MKSTGNVLAAALLILAGCSSFDREWRSAGREPVPADGISGRWIGTWQNTNNTHSDTMRAVLTDSGDGAYRAHFHARYKRIFSFAYTVKLAGQREADRFRFHGESDLGPLAGGIYRYNGWATPTNFFSTYDSRYDVGTFTLHRRVR
ncbi:MAG: hypothetical protein EXS36_10465 [Pedosphaera sp.]|nr:hypothetical protein [Pedosphaera sp.]